MGGVKKAKKKDESEPSSFFQSAGYPQQASIRCLTASKIRIPAATETLRD